IAIRHLCGDYLDMHALSEAMIELCKEHGFPHWLASGQMSMGRCFIGEGEFDRGLEVMREGLAGTRQTGTDPVFRFGLTLMAEAWLCVGKIADGLAAIDEAAEAIEADDQHFLESEVWRLRGELQLAGGSERDAEASFRRAIETARSQQARSWELRAAISLAR